MRASDGAPGGARSTNNTSTAYLGVRTPQTAPASGRLTSALQKVVLQHAEPRGGRWGAIWGANAQAKPATNQAQSAIALREGIRYPVAVGFAGRPAAWGITPSPHSCSSNQAHILEKEPLHVRSTPLRGGSPPYELASRGAPVRRAVCATGEQPICPPAPPCLLRN